MRPPAPWLRRALDRLDGGVRFEDGRPSLHEDTTRYPAQSWDLRTFIALFPRESPLRYLNLNVTLGLTGTAFDQTRRRSRRAARDAFDLQLCLEGRGRHATEKSCLSVGRDVKYAPDGIDLRVGDRVELEGAWPSYRVRYSLPSEELELSLDLDAWPGVLWWARLPRGYCHYTTFCTAQVKWRWGDEGASVRLPAIHDHGWGGTLLPMRAPLRLFRYEVLRLPGDGHALALRTTGSAGQELRRAAVVRRGAEPAAEVARLSERVLEWDVFSNFEGRPRRVPRRWTGRIECSQGELAYEAVRATEPRAVLGDGFLYGFDYEARWMDAPGEAFEGEGYAEQLGTAWTPAAKGRDRAVLS